MPKLVSQLDATEKSIYDSIEDPAKKGLFLNMLRSPRTRKPRSDEFWAKEDAYWSARCDDLYALAEAAEQANLAAIAVLEQVRARDESYDGTHTRLPKELGGFRISKMKTTEDGEDTSSEE